MITEVLVMQDMVLGLLPTTDQIRFMKDGGMYGFTFSMVTR